MVSKHGDPENGNLKVEWDYNVRRMRAWAESGYPGAFEPVFLPNDVGKNEDGGEIEDKDLKKKEIRGDDGKVMHTPPKGVDEYWSKMEYRKEAAPKQNKISRLPQSNALDDIRAQIGLTLKRAAENPELIRGECGEKLGVLNETIKKMSSDYVKRFNEAKTGDQEEIQSLIDQRVPDIRILQMIVEFVERMVTTGQDTLEEAEGVMVEYNLLKTSLERAGHPMEWFDLIETTVKQKLQLARNFLKEHPDMDYHEQPGLWQMDLDAWLINKVHTTGHHSSSQIVAGQTGSERSSPNQQPVASGAPIASDVSSSGARDQDEMQGVASHGAAAEQPPFPEGANVAQGMSSQASTSKFADAVKISCASNYVVDGGHNRKIEGYRKKGLGHSLLIRMNKPEDKPALCELTAAGPFGRGKLKGYQALSDARQILRQTDLKHLDDKSITDLHCTFIAVQRDTASCTIIGGRFVDDPKTLERHYFRSQLDAVMGKASVDEYIKKIWPDLYDYQGADVEPTEPETEGPSAPVIGKDNAARSRAPTQRRSAQTEGRRADDNQTSQLGKCHICHPEQARLGNRADIHVESMQKQMEMLMAQMAALQSTLGGGIRT